MSSAPLMPWRASLDLGGGRVLFVELEDQALHLRLGDQLLDLPSAALPDLAGLVSRACAEATWRAAREARR